MTEKCSELFSLLNFDKLTMTNTAAGYFLDITILRDNNYTCSYDYTKFKWNCCDRAYKQKFFRNLADLIKANIQLFSELEYFTRGILMSETKTHLLNMIKLCNIISDNVLLDYINLKENDSLSKTDIDKMMHIYSMSRNSSLLVLFDVLYSLGASMPVKIYAHNDVFIIVYLFRTLVESCDNDGFIPCIGPYLDPLPDTGVCKLYDEGSAMIVCKTADLDSAVASVINGAWSYRGFLPYALQRIFVQENVWEIFVSKLSTKVKEFTWNFPNNYMPISYNHDITKKAKSKGHKVITSDSIIFDHLKPAIILDEDPYFWEETPKDFPPVATLQPFRTCKEVLLLFNKVPMKYVSLWCNDISICNEVSMAINADNVWINNFGLYDPAVGMQQQLQKKSALCLDSRNPTNQLLNTEMTPLNRQTELTKLHKADAEWSKLSHEQKLSSLKKVIQNIENDLSGLNVVDKKTFTDAIKDAKLLLAHAATSNDVFNKPNYMCVQLKKPLGNVVIKNENKSYGYISAVIAALVCGNAVILIPDSKELCEFSKKFLELNIPVVASVPQDMDARQIFYSTRSMDNFNIYHNIFTNTKSIWYTYGDSFYDAKMLNVTG